MNQKYLPSLIQFLNELVPKASISLELATILREGFEHVRLNPDILAVDSIESSGMLFGIHKLAKSSLLYIQVLDVSYCQ